MKKVETITYFAGELFTITFSHSGFDGISGIAVSEILSLKPEKETELLFNRFNIGYALHTNTFVCFIHSRLLSPPTLQPRAAFAIPDADTRFRFLVKADSRFMSMTQINPVSGNRAYYFSNRENAATDMIISHDTTGVNDNDLRSGLNVDIRETYLGVIDVFSSGAVNNNYELFAGASGELRSPAYKLTFKSSV